MKRFIIALFIFLSASCMSTFPKTDISDKGFLNSAENKTVLINLECEDPAKEGWGSGVIYKGNRVVTAAHVVEDVEGCDIIVSREGERGYSSSVIKSDKELDLSVLKVDHDYNVTSYFKESRLGEKVVVLGYPAQFLDIEEQYLSILFGNVSTKSIEAGKRKVDRISAPIFLGNSGGPVFNSKGQVVGIISSGHFSTQGYFYMVRSKDVIDFLGKI